MAARRTSRRTLHASRITRRLAAALILPTLLATTPVAWALPTHRDDELRTRDARHLRAGDVEHAVETGGADTSLKPGEGEGPGAARRDSNDFTARGGAPSIDAANEFLATWKQRIATDRTGRPSAHLNAFNADLRATFGSAALNLSRPQMLDVLYGTGDAKLAESARAPWLVTHLTPRDLAPSAAGVRPQLLADQGEPRALSEEELLASEPTVEPDEAARALARAASASAPMETGVPQFITRARQPLATAPQQEWLGRAPRVTVSPVVRAQTPALFGDKTVNGRTLNVEQVIGALVAEFGPEIAERLGERREVLDSPLPVREKYAFPSWDQPFSDAFGNTRTFRQIVQGAEDNFMGRKTELAWRLNDEVPIPDKAHPLKHPGLQLTGPWHPLDMAVKQIEADVAATMGPDDEDAAPPHYVPAGAATETVGLYASRDNERRLLAGEVSGVTMMRKGQPATYRITKPLDQRPASFHRVPGIHLRDRYVTLNGKPVPAILVDYAIHALNDFGSVTITGNGLWQYQPKIQTPQEALIVAKLVWRLEQLMGAEKPGEFIKFEALFEEGRAGLSLPIIAWIWRPWLIGTNVGRWDYTGSLIEMWKDERVVPDPQNGRLMGMAAFHMMAYQKFNALLMVMVGMKDGQLTNAAPIGGMAAVMPYLPTDPYGRARHNAAAFRGMKLDKLRERLIGLMLRGGSPSVAPTPVDAYRQSWVATPDPTYVAAGNGPLRAQLAELQAMLDAPEAWVEIDGERVAPTVESGLTQAERDQFIKLGLLNAQGQITPWVLPPEAFESPEALFSSTPLWGGKNLWDALYDIPPGEITVEDEQHAFYMDGQYGFQILNGNLAAAIDDYAVLSPRPSRFMNDLATYRIFNGWPWTVIHLGARITKGGWLKRPRLTADGVIPGENAIELKAGTVVTPEIFEQLWQLHLEWTEAFFKDQDRLAALRLIAAPLVDRLKGADHRKREDLIALVVQQANLSALKQRSPEELAARVARVLEVEPSAVEADLTKLQHVAAITPILSQAYGKAPAYKRELSLNDAAAQVAGQLGVEPSVALAEIKATAPRFDRTKALVIMDVLKRQMLSPRYIQHSPRVLFAIASADERLRGQMLDAFFGPGRAAVVHNVRAGAWDPRVLEAYDEVYDVAPKEVAQARWAKVDPTLQEERGLAALRDMHGTIFAHAETALESPGLFLDWLNAPNAKLAIYEPAVHDEAADDWLELTVWNAIVPERDMNRVMEAQAAPIARRVTDAATTLGLNIAADILADNAQPGMRDVKVIVRFARSAAGRQELARFLAAPTQSEGTSIAALVQQAAEQRVARRFAAMQEGPWGAALEDLDLSRVTVVTGADVVQAAREAQDKTGSDITAVFMPLAEIKQLQPEMGTELVDYVALDAAPRGPRQFRSDSAGLLGVALAQQARRDDQEGLAAPSPVGPTPGEPSRVALRELGVTKQMVEGVEFWAPPVRTVETQYEHTLGGYQAQVAHGV